MKELLWTTLGWIVACGLMLTPLGTLVGLFGMLSFMVIVVHIAAGLGLEHDGMMMIAWGFAWLWGLGFLILLGAIIRAMAIDDRDLATGLSTAAVCMIGASIAMCIAVSTAVAAMT